MPTLDGSSPAAVWDNTQAATAVSSAAFTPPAGSLVVAKVFVGDSIESMTGVPTATGLTFTSQLDTGLRTSGARIYIFTATGAGASTSVSTGTFSSTGATQARGLVVEVWTAAQLAATPATNATFRTTTTAPSATITTTGTGSVVTWGLIDYVGSTTAPTYRSSAVQVAYNTTPGSGTDIDAYQAAAVAGAQTYGLTAPSMSWILGAMEIQAAAAATSTAFRRIGKRRW